jgi:YVTN family beta-propeller protein
MMRFISIFICSLVLAFTIACSANQPPLSEGYLLVTNVLEKKVSIIDPKLEQEVARIPVTGVHPGEVEAFPRQIAVSADGGNAWVPIYSDTEVGGEGTDGRSITIIDLKERKVAGTVDLGKPVRPYMPAFGPKDGLLYVTTELDNSVTIVDPKTRSVVGSIPTGAEMTHGLVISKDGTRIYTWNVVPGSISVLDVPSRKLVKKIELGGQVQRLALSKDDTMLYASDQTQPRLIVIDTKTNEVVRYIKAPSVCYALAMSPDGSSLLVAVPFRGMLAKFDVSKSDEVKTFNVLRNPQSIVFRPDGQEAYVSVGSCNAVGIIDVKEWKVRKYIKIGLEADGIAWAPAAR